MEDSPVKIIGPLRAPVKSFFISNQRTQFLNNVVRELMENYQINHRFYTPYYPQCNGQVKSRNKVLQNILPKIVNKQQNSPHSADWNCDCQDVRKMNHFNYKEGNTQRAHQPNQNHPSSNRPKKKGKEKVGCE